MKDFFERCHGSVGHSAVHLNKKVCHVALPPCIDFSLGHTSAGVLEVFGLEISDQKTVRAQEQRVIIPSCLAERSPFPARPSGDVLCTLEVFPASLAARSRYVA